MEKVQKRSSDHTFPKGIIIIIIKKKQQGKKICIYKFYDLGQHIIFLLYSVSSNSYQQYIFQTDGRFGPVRMFIEDLHSKM